MLICYIVWIMHIVKNYLFKTTYFMCPQATLINMLQCFEFHQNHIHSLKSHPHRLSENNERSQLLYYLCSVQVFMYMFWNMEGDMWYILKTMACVCVCRVRKWRHSIILHTTTIPKSQEHVHLQSHKQVYRWKKKNLHCIKWYLFSLTLLYLYIFKQYD